MGILDAPASPDASKVAPIAGLLHKLRTNQPVKVLLCGGSLLGGYLIPTGGNGAEASYQAAVEGTGRQMVTQLAARYGNTNTTIVNTGVAGSSVSDLINGGRAGLTPPGPYRARADAPDAVIVNINNNDANGPWSRNAASMEAAARTLLVELARWCPNVLIVPPFTHIPVTGDYAAYPAAIYRAAAAAGAYVVSVESTLVGATDTVTYDGTHPNVVGAQRIGAAFAAHFPAPSNRISTVVTSRAPRGDWTDPVKAAGFYEWLTSGGVLRRHRMPPAADTDGWAATSPPKYAGTGLMLRDSLFLTDCVQDSGDTTAIRDLSGHGIDGWLGAVKATTTDHPTWTAGGGLTFAGAQFARIPLDTLGKRDIAPAGQPLTVRAVFRASTSSPYTVVGRRGDAPATLFGLYATSATGLTVIANNQVTGPMSTPSPLTDAHLDAIFTCWAYPSGGIQGKLYVNGALVSSAVDVPTTATTGRDFDWTLGGRWNGTTQAAATPNRQFSGTLHWVDIARCYIRDDAEAAALYATLKAKLNAERSLALP